MSIRDFLAVHGYHGHGEFEGHIQDVPGQVSDLITLTSSENIQCMEIGFNAGHSAEILLKHNPTLTLTSFDIGSRGCVQVGKAYIDSTYPGRHTLFIGDSTKTVPAFIQANKGKTFDVIFIDGGHDYHVAVADITNCANLAHSNTTVIVDDTVSNKELQALWNIGPTLSWNEQVNSQKISQIVSKDYCYGRGMSWGKYNKNV